MTPLALYVFDKTEIIAYACGVCRIVRKTHEEALSCCAPRLCACGVQIEESYYTACKACREEAERAREAEKFEKAEKILAAEWSGAAMWCECCSEYFSDVESFIDGHDDPSMPRYAWDCDSIPLTLDAHEVVEQALEHQEHHEDAGDKVGDSDLKTLQEAMDKFSESVGITSWFASNKRAVILDAAVDEYLRDNGMVEDEESEPGEVAP